MSVHPIPSGYHTVTPFLTVPGAAELIDFLHKAVGAVELERIARPDGKIAHAEIRIGDSRIMLADAMDESCQPTRCALYLYVEDVDSLYQQAVAAGGESISPPVDQFWGDRQAGVKDRFGNDWFIASRVEEVTPEELEKRMAAAVAAQQKG